MCENFIKELDYDILNDEYFYHSYKIDSEFRDLTEDEVIKHWDQCVVSMRKELKAWLDNQVIRPVRLGEALRFCKPMESRWVMQWKMIDGKKGIKSRLTPKGYMDKQKESLVTQAATASALTHRLVASKATCQKKLLASFDIGTAFLKGVTFDELQDIRPGEVRRRVYFNPPDEVTWRLLYDLQPEMFSILEREFLDDLTLECDKSGYRCVDAPRLWRMHLDQTLVKKLKLKKSRYDECLYYWYDERNQKHGVKLSCSTHVDDLECEGSFEDVMWLKRELEKVYGPLKMQVYVYKHCGVEYW